ncbi:hypothetical protein RUM43_001234 [Polyplax serrata]|uniref:Uncharacterized protein n=1 Tax=Polyplax serrata TaxID=468196 RepID=A0AAN8SDH8_POLSC
MYTFKSSPSVVFIALLVCTECFIIPEEFPSLLSLVYSNIPPVKKGTDSRVGIGFKLGPHADFQVLLELGPQTRTDPLGSTTPDNSAKRETVIMKNPQSLVDYVSNVKKYFTPEKKTEKVTDTPGGQWIDWWRNNVLTTKEIGKIQFNKIPGIDDRISQDNKKKFIMTRKDFDHLKQLYKQKVNEKSQDV